MSDYAYTFAEFQRRHKPSRSVAFRANLARNLVKLASRIDGRPNVKYSIAHHHPLGWTTTR